MYYTVPVYIQLGAVLISSRSCMHLQGVLQGVPCDTRMVLTIYLVSHQPNPNLLIDRWRNGRGTLV